MDNRFVRKVFDIRDTCTPSKGKLCPTVSVCAPQSWNGPDDGGTTKRKKREALSITDATPSLRPCKKFSLKAEARLHTLRYKIEIVSLLVCLLIARERTNRFIPNLVNLFLEAWKKYRRWKVREKYLSLIPDDGVSCTSETKHDKTTTPKPKLFPSKILEKQRQEPRKTALGSIPNEDVFCKSETICHKTEWD
jgi:hypothetical protein